VDGAPGLDAMCGCLLCARFASLVLPSTLLSYLLLTVVYFLDRAWLSSHDPCTPIDQYMLCSTVNSPSLTRDVFKGGTLAARLPHLQVSF
jgi:hypothetical protein